ncbi:hypothetical protein AAMO2058_001369700 [Amorphochlora amoebiformis]
MPMRLASHCIVLSGLLLAASVARAAEMESAAESLEFDISGLQDPSEIAKAFASQKEGPQFSFQSLSNKVGSRSTMDMAMESSDDDGTGSGDYGALAGSLTKMQQEQLMRLDEKLTATNHEMSVATKALMKARKCAMRAVALEARMRALYDKKQHFRIQKRRVVLQAKLDAQTSDLHDIDRMSEALQDKFSDLQHTQTMIRDSIFSTRSTLSRLGLQAGTGSGTADAQRVVNQAKADHENKLANLDASNEITEQQLADAIKTATVGQIDAATIDKLMNEATGRKG